MVIIRILVRHTVPYAQLANIVSTVKIIQIQQIAMLGNTVDQEIWCVITVSKVRTQEFEICSNLCLRFVIKVFVTDNILYIKLYLFM